MDSFGTVLELFRLHLFVAPTSPVIDCVRWEHIMFATTLTSTKDAKRLKNGGLALLRWIVF